MRTDYLNILTKNLTAQSVHLNYAVLPQIIEDSIKAATHELFVCCRQNLFFSKKQALNINEARCSFITISADWIHTVIHYSVTPTFFNAKAKYSSNVISWFNSFSHHSLLCSQTVKPSISTEAAAFSIASFLVHMINHSLISVCIYIKIALVKPVFFY